MKYRHFYTTYMNIDKFGGKLFSAEKSFIVTVLGGVVLSQLKSVQNPQKKLSIDIFKSIKLLLAKTNVMAFVHMNYNLFLLPPVS